MLNIIIFPESLHVNFMKYYAIHGWPYFKQFNGRPITWKKATRDVTHDS